MNTFGLIIGLLTLFIIGLGFVWVIYGERYFSYLWWPYVVGLGVITIGISLLIEQDLLSAIVGVLGASFVWGATELKAQAVRSELGWFKYRGRKISAPWKKYRANQIAGIFSGPPDLAANLDDYLAEAYSEIK